MEERLIEMEMDVLGRFRAGSDRMDACAAIAVVIQVFGFGLVWAFVAGADERRR
jgi:hypothetical protein